LIGLLAKDAVISRKCGPRAQFQSDSSVALLFSGYCEKRRGGSGIPGRCLDVLHRLLRRAERVSYVSSRWWAKRAAVGIHPSAASSGL
jgi:hypothetical protein